MNDRAQQVEIDLAHLRQPRSCTLVNTAPGRLPPDECESSMAGCRCAQVKEAAASAEPWLQLPDLAENLGHMALAEGRVKDALQIYGSVQRRHHRGTSAQMLLLCSRALYDEDGRRSAAESRKPSLLPEARTCLYKAIHLDPANMTLRFNAAFVMQVRPLAGHNQSRCRLCWTLLEPCSLVSAAFEGPVLPHLKAILNAFGRLQPGFCRF